MPRPARRMPVLLLCLLAGLAALPAAAQDFPSKPIRLVVPWPPGGNIDITARTLGPVLGDILGTSVVVDNKVGGVGTIGTTQVAKAAPDGYTLLLGSTATITVAPWLIKGIDFDPLKDLAAIGPIQSAGMVLAAHPKAAVSTYQEFLALAAARRGKLPVAMAVGATTHLALELLIMRSGIEVLQVPYKGSGPALNDAVAGQVEMIVDQVSTALPHLKEGRLKPLAVTTRARLPQLPDVPTLAELGLADYEASTFSGLFGPAGMPRTVLDRLIAAHAKAMADPKVRERFAMLGADIMDMPLDTFVRFLKQDSDKWRHVITTANIKVE